MLNVLVTGSNGQLGSEIKELILGSGASRNANPWRSPLRVPHSDIEETQGGTKVPHPKSTLGSGAFRNANLWRSPLRVPHSDVDEVQGAAKAAHPNRKFFFTDRESLDITNAGAIKEFVERNAINTIINCAAYTAVDKAESDEANANAINHLAVKNLAHIAKEKNIKLVHISTDYVYDGENFKPYTEEDATNPHGVYGATKLAGEEAIKAINPPNAIIIRTSWVYSYYGANFVKTMLRLGKEKESLGVIYDQVGTPTYAKDLAKAILEIVNKLGATKVTHPNTNQDNSSSFPSFSLETQIDESVAAVSTHSQALAWERESDVQIYHYSNEGVLSWYDFAKEIMKMAKLDCKINPIETVDYPTPASRPHYSLLNKSKIKKEFNITIPYWKDSLDECLTIMGERR